MTMINGSVMGQYREVFEEGSAVRAALDEIAVAPSVTCSGSQMPVATDALERFLGRAATPPKIQISVVGSFNAGKSTLLNALLGGRFLSEAVVETTAVVTRVFYGPTFGARVATVHTSELKTQLDALRRLLAEKATLSEDPGVTEDDLVPKAPPPECDRVLGALGAFRRVAVDHAAFLALLGCWKENGRLPELPVPPGGGQLGEVTEIRAESAADLERQLRAFTTFPDAQQDRTLRTTVSFLVERAEVFGPFDVLRRDSDGDLAVELVDTPGLQGCTAVAKVRTYDHLTEADCVILALQNKGVISGGDLETIVYLYRQLGRVRKLIIAMTQIDTCMGGDSAEQFFRDTLPDIIENNRQTLESSLIVAGLASKEAAEIAKATPIVPLCALAHRERQLSPRPDNSRARDFPTDKEDGFDALQAAIRECLDGDDRLRSIVQDGRRAIDETVSPVEHWLQTAAEKRTLGADELQKEIDSLGGVIRSRVEGLAGKLDGERTAAADEWTKRMARMRGEFDAGLTQVALKLPRRFGAFVERCSEEKRWNTLAAIIRRAGTFDDGAHDRVFLEEMMTDVFLPTMTPHSQQYLAKLKAETAKMLADAGQTGRARISELLRELETEHGSDFGKKLNGRLEAQCTRAVSQLETKLEALVDKANTTADRAYQSVGRKLVESWAKPLKFDGGKGFRQRALDGLRRTLEEGVAKIPQMVGAELGPELDRIGREAKGIGGQLFDDLAKEARGFIENELKAVQASMESAKNGTKEKLAQESQELKALLVKLRAARSSRVSKPSAARVATVASASAPGTNVRDPGAGIFDEI